MLTDLVPSAEQLQQFDTVQVLIQPGWHNSGPEHWQTLWQKALGARGSRIAHEDWERPLLSHWQETAERTLAAATFPVIFVGHSLGCILAAHLSAGAQAHKIAGAFLCAPADVERDNRPAELANFAPIPMRRLPFPSMVAASDNDPYCRLERAQALAAAWGSEFCVVKDAGHITGGSGYGPWPEGFAMLAGLAARAKGNSK